jgi:hypothetical protein
MKQMGTSAHHAVAAQLNPSSPTVKLLSPYTASKLPVPSITALSKYLQDQSSPLPSLRSSARSTAFVKTTDSRPRRTFGTASVARSGKDAVQDTEDDKEAPAEWQV